MIKNLFTINIHNKLKDATDCVVIFSKVILLKIG